MLIPVKGKLIPYFRSVQIVDTHSHMYLSQFNKDRSVAIERAIELGVDRIFLPNIDSGTVDSMMDLVEQFPNNCFPMMGLHPCSVKENVEDELTRIKSYLDKGKYWAVGEIGIDLHWDTSFLEEQKVAFRKQISWAKEKQLPIVIHARKSFDEIFEIVDELNDDKLWGIFHCFTGSYEQAKKILDYGGFKLGIGGVLTYKNAGLAETVARLNPADLVLETDAPYLSPVPYRGKRNETSYTYHVAEKLAEIYNMPLQEIALITTASAHQVFDFK